MPFAEVEVNRSPLMPARLPSLAARLGELRRKGRRSCSAVADAAGISRQHLWRIEQGIVRNPAPELLVRLARAYGLMLGELLGERAVPQATHAAAVSGDREEILRRLMRVANSMCDDDWQALDELADRASTRLVAMAR